MRRRAEEGPTAAWVIGDGRDTARGEALVEVLRLHELEVEVLAEDLEVDGRRFHAGGAWVVPAVQRQAGLVEALMERRTEFADPVFYDVSAWTLPLAYGLPCAALTEVPRTDSGTTGETSKAPASEPRRPGSGAAWAIPWNQLDAPRALRRLLEAEVRVRTALRPFTGETVQGPREFGSGTLLIPAGSQELPASDLAALLTDLDREGIRVEELTRGLTPAGPDLGARHFRALEPPQVVLLAGPSVSASEVGEVWYLMDRRLGTAPVIVDWRRFPDLPLFRFTHLVMVDGEYDELPEDLGVRVAGWVKEGGVLIATRAAASWAEGLDFGDSVLPGPADQESAPAEPPGERTSEPPIEKDGSTRESDEAAAGVYGSFEEDRARRLVGGAIVEGRLDLTHPLALGFEDTSLPLFRRGEVLLAPGTNPYTMPLRYADEPLMAGYLGPGRRAELPGAPALIAERRGRGAVVRFADDPLFRGFWRGTERLFVNALYFSRILDETRLPD
jgi:hypothetical protein